MPPSPMPSGSDRNVVEEQQHPVSDETSKGQKGREKICFYNEKKNLLGLKLPFPLSSFSVRLPPPLLLHFK